MGRLNHSPITFYAPGCDGALKYFAPVSNSFALETHVSYGDVDYWAETSFSSQQFPRYEKANGNNFAKRDQLRATFLTVLSKSFHPQHPSPSPSLPARSVQHCLHMSDQPAL